jgi:hypothetical protein
MSIRETLEGLADPTRRQDAARALLEELREIAQYALSRASETDREDAVQRVALKLWTMTTDGTIQRISGRRYVRAMLLHSFYNALRQEKIRRGHEGEAGRTPKGQPTHEPVSPETIVSDLQRLVDQIIESAIEARTQNQEDLRRDAAQVFALATGTTTMTEVLSGEGFCPEVTSKERKRIVDRVLKRHSRTRKELQAAVIRLEASEAIAPDEAADLREICQLFFKCQKVAPAGLSSDEEER